MCLGIPAKIISLEGDLARVSIGGVEYTASISLLDDIRVGDFVIVHAGFAIEKVDPLEAMETMRLVQEIEAQSRKND
jgi:hydrogenase expression/formation protein HypC